MNEEIIKLLIIEDEEFDIRRIYNTIKPFSNRLEVMDTVSNAHDALAAIEKQPDGFDVVIMDYQISGGLKGENLIREIKKRDSTLQIIVITKMTLNQTDLYFANQLIESGAFWFGTKYPGDIEKYIYQPTDFILSITNAFERKKLEIEKNKSQKKLDRSIRNILSNRPLVGEAENIDSMRQLIQRYAETNASVLITGESGTGKELVAMNIHYQSHRKYENFITLNCAAIPKDLIESELFGFEKGAFTGAREGKPGLFEQADGGTIFLDEIGEMPKSVQAKLLRVLDIGEVDKIGRKRKYKVDVRIIASTNRDLERMMERKQFREDLFYRLNILHIHTPPLRERIGDIPLLVNHFMNHYSRDFGIIQPNFTDSAIKLMVNYHWRGNVRQLKNVVQRLILTANGEVDDDAVCLCLGLRGEPEQEQFGKPSFDSQAILPLRDMERSFRKNYIKFVRTNSESDADAAQKLGVAPPNFHRMCKELGLK